MATDTNQVVSELRALTVTRLRERYAEVFGEKARSFNKQHLVKRIAWRVQVLAEGDLSERARQRARELANDADLRVRPPAASVAANTNGRTVVSAFRGKADDRLPLPGALLTRRYKGRTVQVRVLPKGFEWDGEVYRSLSAVARKITGAHWNGYHFFGLSRPAKEDAAG